MNYANDLKAQSQRESARADQVENSAGGFVFALSDLGRAERFLILGNEGGTYYASQRQLTRENATAIENCWTHSPKEMRDLLVDVSAGGRSYKNDACIFALALGAASKNPDARKLALASLNDVCRIGTHLFTFMEMVKSLRGWGRGLRKAVANWYLTKEPTKLAYQLVKYRQRNGWAHRDVLRVAHPHTYDSRYNALFNWVTHPDKANDWNIYPDVIHGYTLAQSENVNIPNLIQLYGLTREMVPTEALRDKEVWRVLLQKMPMTATIRNLGNMSKVGLLVETDFTVVNDVVNKITNTEMLRKARVHPLQILAALVTYAKGHGARGRGEWPVVPRITRALNDAFSKSFKLQEPTNKRIMIGLDVSGSMGMGDIAGIPGISPRVGSAAMCMTHLKTEPNVIVRAFTGGSYFYPRNIGTNGLTKLDIHGDMDLNTVISKISGLPFGPTDCALPMLWAMENRAPIDAFIIYTDNETWCGDTHPYQALRDYRKQMGINAKLIVVGMTATNFSIADPNDPGMLDVVGFDTAAPSLINQFIKG